jgi:hypothetical protein
VVPTNARKPTELNDPLDPTKPAPLMSNDPQQLGTGKPGAARKEKVDVYNGDEVLARIGLAEERKIDPVAAFDKFLTYAKPDKLPHYSVLHEQVKRIAAEQEDKAEDKKLDEIVPTKKSCQRILAEYLYETGKKVNEKFYMILIIFVRLYLDCLNEYGWELLRKHRQVTIEERKKEFTCHNDAELVPEASNDFVRIYVPKESPKFDKNLSIELTRHLCEWTHASKYTHLRVALI